MIAFEISVKSATLFTEVFNLSTTCIMLIFFNAFLKFKVYIFVKYTIVFNISLVLRLSILLIEVSEPACLNTYILCYLSAVCIA